MGIHNYFMMRALGTLSRVLGGLVAGVFGMVDGSVMTSRVITCKI